MGPTFASALIKVYETQKLDIVETGITKAGIKFYTDIFAGVGREIANAERFILSDETSLAVSQLTQKLPVEKIFIEQREYVRPPYEHVWVEMKLTDDVKKLRTERRDNPIVRPVSNIGMLISTRDRVSTMSNYWMHDDGQFGFGMFETIVNLGDDVPTTFLTPYQHQAYEHAITTGMDPTVALEVSRRTMWLPNIILLKLLGDMYGVTGGVKKFQQMIAAAEMQGVKSFVEATEDNPTLFGAWLLTMNAKSGMTRTPSSFEHSKKVVSFGSRKKKPAVKNYRYTLISMTDYENTDGSPKDTHKRNLLNAHYVRGHFKNRSTGMFWWNPFIRGTGTTKRREGYIVKE